ncbi:MAG: RING-HC finger protein [Endozoicomonas sp. (ex Botrylloides leachii)]|nr:RING-HC finger protein [Endozoicomonas sp. (ex Botrylloides leachii)]
MNNTLSFIYRSSFTLLFVINITLSLLAHAQPIHPQTSTSSTLHAYLQNNLGPEAAAKLSFIKLKSDHQAIQFIVWEPEQTQSFSISKSLIQFLSNNNNFYKRDDNDIASVNTFYTCSPSALMLPVPLQKNSEVFFFQQGLPPCHASETLLKKHADGDEEFFNTGNTHHCWSMELFPEKTHVEFTLDPNNDENTIATVLILNYKHSGMNPFIVKEIQNAINPNLTDNPQHLINGNIKYTYQQSPINCNLMLFSCAEQNNTYQKAAQAQQMIHVLTQCCPNLAKNEEDDIIQSDCRIKNFEKDPPGQASIYICPTNLLQTYSARLSSFTRFPEQQKKFLPRLALLAKDGFYYTGYSDQTKCWYCGITAHCWEFGDQSAFFDDSHRTQRHNQGCPVVTNTTEENDPLLTAYEQRLKALEPFLNTTQGNSHRPIQQQRLCQQQKQPLSIIFGNFFNAEQEAFVRSLDLSLEANRYQTFATWPCYPAPMLPIDLAEEGFFYLGNLDRAQCAFCSGILRNWAANDVVQEQHSRHFGNCSMHKGDSRNQPLEPNIRNQNLQELTAKIEAIKHNDKQYNILTELEKRKLSECLSLNNPTSPHMQHYQTRQATFNDSWPTRIKATKEQIAKAGFFYLNESDKTKCFYCNGGLQNWDDNDDPFIEHAKWFPRCAFIISTLGVTYVKGILDRHPNLNRPLIRNPVTLDNLTATINSKQPDNTPHTTHTTTSPKEHPSTAPAEGACAGEPMLTDQHEQQMTITNEKRKLSELLPLNYPSSPHMRCLATRIQTFNHSWPKRIKASTEQIAKAGFFYLGMSDKTTCYYCNGGVENWGNNDDPFIEHAKWFPGCAFIIRTLGVTYVKGILNRHPNLNRPWIGNAVNLDDLTAAINSKQHDNTPHTTHTTTLPKEHANTAPAEGACAGEPMLTDQQMTITNEITITAPTGQVKNALNDILPLSQPYHQNRQETGNRQATFQGQYSQHSHLAEVGLFLSAENTLTCYYCNGKLTFTDIANEQPIIAHGQYYPNCPLNYHLGGVDFAQLMKNKNLSRENKNTILIEPTVVAELLAPAQQARAQEQAMQIQAQENPIQTREAWPHTQRGQEQYNNNQYLPENPASLPQEAPATTSSIEATLPQSLNQTLEKMLCPSCKESQNDILFIPCGHIAYCSSCSEKKKPKRCPQCNEMITDRLKIYRS